MALALNQTCHVDVSDRARGFFTVAVYSEDGQPISAISCTDEAAAVALCDAINAHADQALRVEPVPG